MHFSFLILDVIRLRAKLVIGNMDLDQYLLTLGRLSDVLIISFSIR